MHSLRGGLGHRQGAGLVASGSPGLAAKAAPIPPAPPGSPWRTAPRLPQGLARSAPQIPLHALYVRNRYTYKQSG